MSRVPRLAVGFWTDKRASVSIAAVLLSVMTVFGVALASEHLWFVHSRNLLRAAADAAAVAANLELGKLPRDLTDEDVDARVLAVATRYARANLDPDIDFDALVEVDRANDTVVVEITSASFSLLLSKFHSADSTGTTVRSGTDAGRGPGLTIILALDVSNSMRKAVNTNSRPANDRDSRINSVRRAALDFVNVVASGDQVSVGFVPWHLEVCRSGKPCGQIQPSVVLPTDDPEPVKRALRNMRPYGGGTSSALGLEESRTLLEGLDADHRRVIILLTDGEDNVHPQGGFCPGGCVEPRREQCTLAKDDDIEIFTVSGVGPNYLTASLKTELLDCASSPDHAFLTNPTSDDIEAAFSEIGRKIHSVRRISVL